MKTITQTGSGAAASPARRTPLNRQQIVGFWGAWFGWMLDGMDSFIYALVLAPALKELLPRAGIAAVPANIGFYGSILFAVFLVGWGVSFIWGPVADRFGRKNTLAGTILLYAVFTGLAAFSQNIWELAIFRFIAGVGVGGEWALAGTYVAESWPEDRRKMGAGYLQTGYYVGFFVAAALNYTIGVHFGWRVMFLCGLAPVIVAFLIMSGVKETKKWERKHLTGDAHPLRRIFAAPYRGQTIVMSLLLTVAIIGLWAGAVYEPTAIIQLALKQGMALPQAIHTASYATALLSIGTILGCLALPMIAESIGRRKTLALYFAIMFVSILAAFGWAFYLPTGHALPVFMVALFFLGVGGANFAMFSLWLPELFPTEIRASAFAFCTSIGRIAGAGVNFILGAAVAHMGTIGTPIAWTAVAFAIGLLIIPFGRETRGETLPE
ncbi:MFS transporter [Acidocella sp.]|uniref:MFS transporter n=1 Tax=Acidocella sp. TaxID=50710 RepID=UPI003D024883